MRADVVAWLLEGEAAGYASAKYAARLFLLETLRRRCGAQTPKSAPRTGHSAAQTRRTQGGP